MDLSWSFQQAVVAALKNTPSVTDLVSGRIYDDVPSNPTFPYVTYGEAVTVEAGASDSDAVDETLTLHAWSEYGGQKETKSILAALKGTLHDADLSMAGAHLVNLRFLDAQTLRDPDGRTYHGVIRFGAHIQKI